MKKYIKPVIVAVCVIAVLVAAYFMGGEEKKAPDKTAFDNKPIITQDSTDEMPIMPMPDENAPKLDAQSGEQELSDETENQDVPKENEVQIPEENPTQDSPDEKKEPVEPQEAVVTDKEYTCTLTVRCDTILNNMDKFDEYKTKLVPDNGIIFGPSEVVFYEGESVFNVLLREMKKNKIHLEFVNTPVYNSVYIEGINNIYEFDCGELSGWMYRVNGWFPNYGSSRYQLSDKDTVEWIYTCDLGADIGGTDSAGQQR